MKKLIVISLLFCVLFGAIFYLDFGFNPPKEGFLEVPPAHH